MPAFEPGHPKIPGSGRKKGQVGIRTQLALTQEEFAARFGFSVNTLRHWEQGKRQPEGATRAYLTVIARAPDAVGKALLDGYR